MGWRLSCKISWQTSKCDNKFCGETFSYKFLDLMENSNYKTVIFYVGALIIELQ